MGSSAKASPKTNARVKANRLLLLRQQRSEINSNGKKVSLVATPMAQTSPVRVARRGIRASRVELKLADSSPIPNKIVRLVSASDGITNNAQQQTATMPNGTTIKSGPNKIP